MRYILHWGRDNARRISSVADLEGLLSFLATIRGQEGAPYGVDLLPAGAAGGGLQLGIGHPHRAFAVWLDAGQDPSVAPGVHDIPGGFGIGDLASTATSGGDGAAPASGGYSAAPTSGGYGIDDNLEAWPEPIGFDCGMDVVDFKPAWTRVTPRLAVRAAREYVLTGAMPTCLRFDPNV